MSNEYKEWLKEQTFESLANDNLRIKLELKTAKEENEKLTQQNKQMREALEKIERYKNNCYMFKVENDTHYIDFKYIWEICNIAQQALKGVE